MPETKSFIEVNNNNSSYKKFVTSNKSIFANQIENVSNNILQNKKNDHFLVNIHDSLKIMNNLNIWSNLIKK